MIKPHVLSLVLLTCLTCIFALPSPPHRSLPRQTISCYSLQSPFDPSCWEKLGVADWLRNWNTSTPICQGFSDNDSETSNGVACCLPTETWSTCFLRLELGQPGYDCSTINPQFCSWNPDQNSNGTNAAQRHYALRAVYAINDFFSTYYTALMYASSVSATKIAAMVQEIDVKTPAFSFQAILTTLTAGLSILGAPGIGASIVGVGSSTLRVSAQAFVISLQQSPGTVKALWPAGGSEESQNFQISELQSELGSTTMGLSKNINNALGLIMSDLPTFIQFTNGGHWTSSQSLSIPQKVDDLDLTLSTYLFSEVLSRNNWWVNPLLDPQYQFPSAQALMAKLGGSGPNSNGLIVSSSPHMPYWYSPVTNRSFLLVRNDFENPPWPYDVLNDAISKKWVDPELFFDGSFNCTWQGRAGNPTLNVLDNGQVDFSCISQISQKKRCNAPCPAGSWLLNGKDCAFSAIDDTC